MLRFVSFGSGSSGNCYLLVAGTEGLIIDVGIGLRTLKKYFREYGLCLASVKNILITHDHADHIKSVGSMSSEFNLPVYATREVHIGIERNYCVQKKVCKDNVRYIEKGQSFKLGLFEVTPFGVPHDSADNVGYRIVYDDTVFCLITDAGSVTDEMKVQIREANYLVLEANYDSDMLANGSYPPYLKRRIASETGHLSNAVCAQVLSENMSNKLCKVWLCHLSEENNHPELARKTVEAILSQKKDILGCMPELLVLKRKTPTGIFELKTKEDLQ